MMRSIQRYQTAWKAVVDAAWVAGGLVRLSLRGTDSKEREGAAIGCCREKGHYSYAQEKGPMCGAESVMDSHGSIRPAGLPVRYRPFVRFCYA